MRHVILRPPPHLTLFTDERICLPSSVLPLKGERDPMSELDDFLTKTLARQVEEEEAFHNGEVSRAFRWMASRFSDCTAYRFELVAAGVSGNLAYTVGFEHTSVSMDGVPVEPYTLRVTHIYRRENGEWKIVHRHGDHPPIDQSPPAEASTT